MILPWLKIPRKLSEDSGENLNSGQSNARQKSSHGELKAFSVSILLWACLKVHSKPLSPTPANFFSLVFPHFLSLSFRFTRKTRLELSELFKSLNVYISINSLSWDFKSFWTRVKSNCRRKINHDFEFYRIFHHLDHHLDKLFPSLKYFFPETTNESSVY